jgi:farnesyl-diphosphate farnesyltransferase
MKRNHSALQSRDVGEQLLQGVSRSFALTIPQLPPDLRRVVTYAYLMCRIVDTIEDEKRFDVHQQGDFFRQFQDVINGRATARQFARNLYPRLSDATLPAEKELIQQTPVVMAAFFSFSPRQQITLRNCMQVMSGGMLRFQKIKNPNGLPTYRYFDEYCYCVAGSVGELLSELFCDYSPEILKQHRRLMQLAVSFGKGLQMTNILKDLWEDRERGVCWLPRDVFTHAGFDLKMLSRNHHAPAFAAGLRDLIGIARAHLGNALAYSLTIPKHETGIRKFCLWAVGMAIFTLRNIHKRPDYTSGREVKISKAAAAAIIAVCNAMLRWNFILKTLFELSAKGLPAATVPAFIRPGDPAALASGAKAAASDR